MATAFPISMANKKVLTDKNFISNDMNTLQLDMVKILNAQQITKGTNIIKIPLNDILRKEISNYRLPELDLSLVARIPDKIPFIINNEVQFMIFNNDSKNYEYIDK